MKKWLATLSLSALTLVATPFANAEVMIAPTRVVFEEGTRSAELVIVNKGDEEAAYRISLENRQMNLDGSMELVDSVDTLGLFADKIVRYSPRRVIMEPGGRQTIRLSAQTSELEPGEYRSHLRLMSAPTSAGRKLQSVSGTNNEGISIQLIAIRSLTIPVIVRVGSLESDIVIDEAALTDVSHSGGSTTLEIKLNREGDKSTYGHIELYIEGESQPIFHAKGIAVYTPNNTRIVKLPLPNEIHDKIASKKIRIVYRSADVSNSSVLAEQIIVLN